MAILTPIPLSAEVRDGTGHVTHDRALGHLDDEVVAGEPRLVQAVATSSPSDPPSSWRPETLTDTAMDRP